MCPWSHLEDQVVDVHLLLLLQDVNNQTVDVVPLPLKGAGSIFVHVQVRLLGQEGNARGDAVRSRLLTELQYT